jgi:maleate cis-trans isomerase
MREDKSVSLEYAPRGLVGFLTPQANTTAEAEAQILLPKGMGLVNARLVSHQPSLEERLKDYFANLDTSIAQFGDAPLAAIGLAVTGASYSMGIDEEKNWLDKVSSWRGVPVISAGLAVRQVLKTLEAKRIALISPYPQALLMHSKAYWVSDGFEVVDVADVVPLTDTANFSQTSHPVYSLGSGDAIQSLKALKNTDADAILFLGTGLPTLSGLLEAPQIISRPVISCNLALTWCCANVPNPALDPKKSLLAWMEGAHWKQRFFERCL